MFKPENKTETIYLYDRYLNGWTLRFPTLDDALKFVVSRGFSYWDKEYNFFDEVNLSNDMYRSEEVKYYTDENTGEMCRTVDVNYYSRRYMFIDKENRVLDLRLYRKELDYFRKNNETTFEAFPKKKKKYYWRNESPRYRIDPIPYTGRHRYFHGSLRAVRTTNEIRMNSNPEHKDYVRPARRPHNLPTIYDDIWRHRSRSWKDCTKKRKQWMK